MAKLKAKPITDTELPPDRMIGILYGKPGCGKTHLCTGLPGVFYYDTENGTGFKQFRRRIKDANGAILSHDEGALNPDTLKEQIKALASEKHDFKWFVIDSGSKLFNVLEMASFESMYGGDMSRETYGKEKMAATRYFKALCSWISSLDMNLLIICHSKDGSEKDDKGKVLRSWTEPDIGKKIEYEVNIVLEALPSNSGNPTTSKMRVIKSRWEEFPQGKVIPMSVEYLLEQAPSLGGEVKSTLTFASKGQIDRVVQLTTMAGISAERIQTRFAEHNATCWAEMPANRVATMIEDLEKHLATTSATPK